MFGILDSQQNLLLTFKWAKTESKLCEFAWATLLKKEFYLNMLEISLSVYIATAPSMNFRGILIEALSRCPIVIVAILKNCCVPMQ